MSATYSELVAKGCLCGTDRPQDCSLHGPSDLRGLAAFYRAGMPNAFPMVATCDTCKAEGLMYPDPGQDDGAPAVHRPSLICPNCSTPACESYLRFAAEEQGCTLNLKTIFPVRVNA